MKRSLEQNIQSAYNRHLYDINSLHNLNTNQKYLYLLKGIDNLIIASIKEYRKHRKTNKDYIKTEISRRKRCNAIRL